MPETSRCRSCGAEILWARTAGGKLMPVDAEPVPDGNVFVARTEVGLTAFVPPAGAVVEGATRHKSHFATCEFADRHRRARS